MDEEWERVWRSVRELADAYPDDIVVIGGVAVYLHTGQRELPAEFTHDADVAIARAALADLRDEYEVVANRRLAKYQITTAEDVDIDLYVERNNRLRLPWPLLKSTAFASRTWNISCSSSSMSCEIDGDQRMATRIAAT